MPLFKGQGCKSTPGKAIAYITDPEKAKYVSGLNLDDGRDYAAQMKETAQLYGKGKRVDERKYYHFKLSCSPSDEVSAEAHQEYAEALAAKLFPGYECVIATHTDTDTVHSHIIVSAISFENGHKLHCNQRAYARMKDLANTLGEERGFTKLDFRKPAQDRVTSQEKLVELKGGTSWKEELREVIRLAKLDTTTMENFEKYLNSYGVKITRNTEKTIAYKHPKKEKAIRGEKLGAAYTKEAVVNEFEQARWRNDSKRGTEIPGRTEQGGIGKHSIEGSAVRVEREVREIVDGVEGYTLAGREKTRTRDEAAERAAREVAQRVEEEQRRTAETAERERRAAAEQNRRILEEAEERERRTISDDFEPSL